MTRPATHRASVSALEIPFRPLSARPRTGRTGGSAATTTERRDRISRERLVERMRGEFCEMPGLHLTFVQASRLFGVRSDICDRILSSLVRDGFLCNVSGGQYCRRDLIP